MRATQTSVGSTDCDGFDGFATSPVDIVSTVASTTPSPFRSISISKRTSAGLTHSAQVAIPNQTVAPESTRPSGSELAAPTKARSATARALPSGFDRGLSAWSSNAETVERASTGGSGPDFRPLPTSGIVKLPPPAGAPIAREAARIADWPRTTTCRGTRSVPAGAPESVTNPLASVIQARFESDTKLGWRSASVGSGAFVTAAGSARTTLTSNVAEPPGGTVIGAPGTSTRTPGIAAGVAHPGVSVAGAEPLFWMRRRRVTLVGAAPWRNAERLTTEGRSSSKAITSVARARAGSTRPAPTRAGPYCGAEPAGGRRLTSKPAVFITAAFSSAGVQPGRCFRRRAITPVRCGAAIEVPDIDSARFPAFTSGPPTPAMIPVAAEVIDTPGAATSGFGPAAVPSNRGPREEKDPRVSEPEKSATVTPSASDALRRFPSESATRTAGIVTAPATAGSATAIPRTPSSLFAMTTPIAPASCARFTFPSNEQSPRSMRAIFPASSAPFVTVLQTRAGSAAASGPIVPFAAGGFPKTAVPAGSRPAREPGPRTSTKEAVTPASTEAATEIAESAAAGLPVTKYVSPALPAEQTTTIPAREAFSAAIAVESSFDPNSLPSERFSTSSRSEKSPSSFGSIAQSIACVVSPVEPEHPKTRSA